MYYSTTSSYLLCKNPGLFDYTITDCWDNLCKTYFTNTIKVGICMSGHLRSYDACKDNINQNIINVLQNSGFRVNLFLSSWTNSSFSPDSSDNNYKADFTDSEFEEYNSEYFIQNFSTEKWRDYQYSCETTSYNAASLWYKANRSYKLLCNYEKENNL